MTPQQIRDLAYRQDHMSPVAPVLLALADLYTSAQDYREAGYTSKLMAALRRLEDLQP